MNYVKELSFAKQVAGEAGLIMQKYYRADQQVETKADNTPVTIADKAVNDIVIKRVKAEYPEHGLLGEEASWQPNREKLWVCDPIDGTPAYVFHVPTSMFSLALVEDGVPVVGIAFNPWTGEVYSAIKHKGAYRDGQRLRVSSQAWGTGVKLSGNSDGSIDGVVKREAMEKLGMTVVTNYSIVFKGCLVAEGSVDGRIWRGVGAHDIAAVKLLVEEAGGKVTDLDGNEQRYDQPINGAVISNGLIHDELLELVKQAKS